MSGPFGHIRELDDLGVGFLPLPTEDCGSSFSASDEEYIDRHGENEIAERDLHVSIDDFIFWDSPHPQWQTRHTLLPAIATRRLIGREGLIQVNANNFGNGIKFNRLTEVSL